MPWRHCTHAQALTVKKALTTCACRQLEQAEAFLRAAGLDPSALKEGIGKKHRKKDKKDKHKHKHRRKHKS